MALRPSVVFFDVVETLISLEPLRSRFTEVGVPPQLLERWFDRLLRDGMALTLAGDYEPFPRVAAAALRTLTRGEAGDDAVEHVLAGFAELPAHSDVEPAMRLLAEHGIRLVCLSNGAARTTEDFLHRTGLASYVEQVLSVADVRSWKPPARVYHYALAKTDCGAEQVTLVAVHAFDCHGAHRAGLATGWASRLEGHYSEIFAPADVVGADLVEVARGLLSLPRADG